MAAGRGRKVTISLLVVVLVLGGLFIAADRVAAYVAERTLAKQAQQQLVARDVQVPQAPGVSIDGFPFLTQVARGRYDKVTISMADPTVQGVRLKTLDVVASGVNASSDAVLNRQGSITADQVTGTATIGWDQVPKLLEQAGIVTGAASVSANDAGQVVVREPLNLQGTKVSVVATGTLAVSDGAVRVKISTVTLDGTQVNPLIARLATAAAGQLSARIKIPALPYNLKVTSVSTTPAGLTATAVAANVPITS